MKIKFYLTIFLLSFSFSVFCHEIEIKDKDIEKIVKLRMKNMSEINSLSKKIYKNLNTPNYEDLIDYTNKLKHNTLEFKTLFPTGSEGGKAKNLIWKDKELFNNYIDTFLKDINLLIVSVENKKINLLNDNFNQLTSNCGSCHKKFKSK